MPQAPDVVIAPTARVLYPDLVNLYGCRIGEHSTIGPFVELQAGVVVGDGEAETPDHRVADREWERPGNAGLCRCERPSLGERFTEEARLAGLGSQLCWAGYWFMLLQQGGACGCNAQQKQQIAASGKLSCDHGPKVRAADLTE